MSRRIVSYNDGYWFIKKTFTKNGVHYYTLEDIEDEDITLTVRAETVETDNATPKN